MKDAVCHPDTYRLLVIEDSCTKIASAIDALTSSAFAVEHQTTMAGGLARVNDADRPKIDAVLLDLTLPNGQGIAVVTNFQRHAPSIPMVVYTGTDISLEQVIQSGAQDLVRKPAKSSVLIDRVISAIARHKVRQEFQPIEDMLKTAAQKAEKSENMTKCKQDMNKQSVGR